MMDALSQLVTLYPNRNHLSTSRTTKAHPYHPEGRQHHRKSHQRGAKFQIWYGANSTDTGELNDLGIYFTDASGQIVLEGLRGRLVPGDGVGTRPGFTIKEPATGGLY